MAARKEKSGKREPRFNDPEKCDLVDIICNEETTNAECFLYQVFYFCNPPCFKPAGKAADTMARRSKSSRQLKQKFSHTRKTPKYEAEAVSLFEKGNCLVVDNLRHRLRFLVVDNF